MFKSPEISLIASHKSKVSATFKLVKANETEEHIGATKLADEVKNDMKHLNFIKDNY